MKRYLIGSVLGLVSLTSLAAQNVILPLTARTATVNSSDIVKTTETGVHFIIRVTVAPGGDTITPYIQGKDALGNYYDLLVGSAIDSTGITVIKLGPSIAPLESGAASDIVPSVYRLRIVASGSGSFTYSVAANQEK